MIFDIFFILSSVYLMAAFVTVYETKVPLTVNKRYEAPLLSHTNHRIILNYHREGVFSKTSPTIRADFVSSTDLILNCAFRKHPSVYRL